MGVREPTFFFFLATPMACGSSRARDGTCATAVTMDPSPAVPLGNSQRPHFLTVLSQGLPDGPYSIFLVTDRGWLVLKAGSPAEGGEPAVYPAPGLGPEVHRLFH